MKYLTLALFTLFAVSATWAQKNAQYYHVSDRQDSLISLTSMNSIEVENIQPDGWFFAPSKGPTEVVLIKDGKHVALGPITSVKRIDDTLSIYTADTVGFPLANADYQMRSKGELYNVHLGRLKAIAIQSADDESWVVFDKHQRSKNNNPQIEKIFSTSNILWKTEGLSNLPGIPAVDIDSVDNDKNGKYTMHVVGPWPWKRNYGSFELDLGERIGTNKTVVYEPNAEVGMLFQFKDGIYLYKGKKFKELSVSKGSKKIVYGVTTIEHKKRAKF